MSVAREKSYGLDPDILRVDLPPHPGVYLFKDVRDRVIYVGKAKDLNRRVMSYLRPAKDLVDKTARMMSVATGLDTIITGTEQEAFILEATLIRKLLPRYNVILRDDKRYPLLRLDVKDSYPCLTVVRRIKKDGAVYFGPFSYAGSMRSTLKVIEKLFPLRKCRGRGVPKRSRPCINHQIGRCLGVCVHPVSPDRYGEVVRQVRLFLEGRNSELIDRLQLEMREAAGRLDFEKAAELRDQIAGVERVVERQHVVFPRMGDLDAVGLAGEGGGGRVAVMYLRGGAIVGSRTYIVDEFGSEPAEIMEAFLTQLYSGQPAVPPEILISDPVEDMESVERWLRSFAGKRVKVHCPVRGDKRRLVDMAVKNADRGVESPEGPDRRALMEMVMRSFGLDSPPRSIEGLDISNFHGQEAVGGVVSFVEGLPDRGGYRSFRIKAVEGVDDYQMMAELVRRRMEQGPPPDLFLVDGGKGHLSAVNQVLDSFRPDKAPAVAAIAKGDPARGETLDKLYVSGRKNPVSAGRNDPVLLLMMRIRDEAHRRALSYHRSLRSKHMSASILDAIPGIGKARKKALLECFGSVDKIAEASPAVIAGATGIPESTARKILEHLAAVHETRPIEK